jgi:spermidine/putrescine-binding protein
VVVDWRLPKEARRSGSTFAIPKSAKNVEEAHEFLNTCSIRKSLRRSATSSATRT